MSKRILVVEDEHEINELICRELEKAGFEVTSAKDGTEALSQIEQAKPDILVTDVVMPGLSGHGLIAELENRSIHLGAIVMSGKQVLNSDVFPFFEKPFSIKIMVDFILSTQDTLGDFQLLKKLALRLKKDVGTIGKVILFYPNKGWGLLRVVGRDEPLYVNASDIGTEKKYVQLMQGQIVEFSVDESASRGARARNVQVIQDVVQPPLVAG